MIKVAIISDLHLDQWETKGLRPSFLDYTNPDNADVLIIAGDLHSTIDKTRELAELFLQHYDKVLFTDGNHEHYAGEHTVIEYENRLNSESTKATYLSGNSIIIDDVGFIGCNGWYDWNCTGDNNEIQICKDATWDWTEIKWGGILPPSLAWRHSAKMINEIILLRNHVREIFVFTHTAPHLKGLVDANHPWYESNGAFYNSIAHRVFDVDNGLIKNWVFGHTHRPSEFVSMGCNYTCNPFGYTHESTFAQRYGVVTVNV